MSEVNTVGEILRQAREAKGESLDDVNRATKISVQVLKSLEQDDFDSFESDIYLKGFVRNYALYLGIDTGDLMQTLDRQRGGGSVSGGGATWETEEAVVEEKLKSSNLFRRVMVPLLLLLILLLIILFVNERRKVSRLTSDEAQGYLDRNEASSVIT